MQAIENQELIKFYQDIRTEIDSVQLSEEEGGIREQIFTELALSLLCEAGETENSQVCYDEKLNKSGAVLHKINGYALSENYETLDLFITIFKNSSNLTTIYSKRDKL